LFWEITGEGVGQMMYSLAMRATPIKRGTKEDCKF